LEFKTTTMYKEGKNYLDALRGKPCLILLIFLLVPYHFIFFLASIFFFPLFLAAMNLAQLRIAEAVTNFYDETATLGLCSLKYKVPFF